jgi:phage terminase large subunit
LPHIDGSPENSPLWQSRVLAEFPSLSSSALFALSWLERARRPAQGALAGEIINGVDVGPGLGKDRTACVAVSGASIVDSVTFTDSDARGPVLARLRRFNNIRLVRVDSAGLGFYFTEHIRDAGYRTVGVNVGGGPDEREKERFRNSKAQRYWFLRERFEHGEVSGLSDELLAELASINYVINSRGQTEIEDKATVKSILGRSPDLAEALMIAIGEHEPQSFEYRPPPAIPGSIAALVLARHSSV